MDRSIAIGNNLKMVLFVINGSNSIWLNKFYYKQNLVFDGIPIITMICSVHELSEKRVVQLTEH